MEERKELIARKVISTIREEFGLKDNERGKKSAAPIMTPSRSGLTLGRAVALLADALYSQTHHFIFELLQNADDNKYLDAAPPTNHSKEPTVPVPVVPSLHFYVSSEDPSDPTNKEGALWVINNEKGSLQIIDKTSSPT